MIERSDWHIVPQSGDPKCPAMRITRNMVRITTELYAGLGEPGTVDFWVNHELGRFGIAYGDRHVVREYDPDHALRVHSTMPARLVDKRSQGVWLSCIRNSAGIWYAQVHLQTERRL